ncbi:hypothetical protein IQ254_08860 [Nodosilinea sp. LEGE 07088]|uniref:hypothetical protein n=1 Tax=Nodosilinea sp. LEGE 07088 TaxID=2777968 RepID=UPI001882C221|nr:hypothetical protein [Nodosilinea sp. LEGE 07088]MBE9137315.1 hypothetical protein [Nodosilinea sp. LEGE 07088]
MDCDRVDFAFSYSQNALHQAKHWQIAPSPETDLNRRAIQYLGVLRDLAVQPSWITLTHVADPPGALLTDLGQHIHRLNQRLDAILNDLLACFETSQRPRVEILAAPLDPTIGIDGFCNHRVTPTILMVDPSRILPADWPALVAHELAHGVAGSSGHDDKFSRAIAYLCLAQDLPLPVATATAESLRYWPPCRRHPQPELFWRHQLPQPDWL